MAAATSTISEKDCSDSDSSVYEDAMDNDTEKSNLMNVSNQTTSDMQNPGKMGNVVEESHAVREDKQSDTCISHHNSYVTERRTSSAEDLTREISSHEPTVSCDEDNSAEDYGEEDPFQALPSQKQSTESERWQQELSPGAGAAPDLGEEETVAANSLEKDKMASDLAIDVESLQAEENGLSEDELENRQKICLQLKEDANKSYRESEFTEAVQQYTQALRTCPLRCTRDRAVLHSNRAAALLAQERLDAAVQDCSSALQLDQSYVRALRRRAELYEKTEKLDESLEDYKRLVQLDPNDRKAFAACSRLPGQIAERNEKLKNEMIDKLKDLGNMVLKPFGLSTNNFQMVQDPNTGGYSVNFNQNSS